MWGGYFTSIRPTMGKLIVNMDRTAMSFIMAGDLVNVATRFMKAKDPSDLARAVDRGRVQLERFVKGLQISTRSMNMTDGSGRSSQNKKFKIRALSREPANALRFEGDNGEQWTIQVSFSSKFYAFHRVQQADNSFFRIQSYFQKIYNYTLRFPNLPCVQVTKKAWYPMEVCTVERGNKYTKKLNPDQVAEALKCKLSTSSLFIKKQKLTYV